MSTNEYGVNLDRNGYAPSILQSDKESDCVCYECGRRARGYYGSVKMDRHEPFGGANRSKSQALGLWVTLCHLGCHEGPGSVHDDPAMGRRMKAEAQRAAMEHYGWSEAEFVRRFGKSFLSVPDARSVRTLPQLSAAAEKVRTETYQSGTSEFRVLTEAPELPY